MANTRAQKTAQNLSTLTTAGDIAYASAAGTPARLGIGSSGQVLKVSGGLPSWGTDVGGKLLQVVQASTSTGVTITTTTLTDTGITATITPSSASSKILVLINAAMLMQGTDINNHSIRGVLFRGATNILDNTRFFGGVQTDGGGENAFVPVSYMDSPSTTSATTYKLQFACDMASSTAIAQVASMPSNILLLEIGA